MRLHIGWGPMYFLRALFSDEHVGNLLVVHEQGPLKPKVFECIKVTWSAYWWRLEPLRLGRNLELTRCLWLSNSHRDNNICVKWQKTTARWMWGRVERLCIFWGSYFPDNLLAVFDTWSDTWYLILQITKYFWWITKYFLICLLLSNWINF